MSPSRHRVAGLSLALSLGLGAGLASAQPLSLAPAFPFSDRSEGVTTLVVSSQLARGYTGDLEVRVRAGWPQREVTVREAVSLPAFVSRQFLVPVPLGRGDYVTAELGGRASASLSASGSGNYTTVGILGLGERIAGALRATDHGRFLQVAVGATSPSSGEHLVPGIVSGWGGVDVVLAGTASILALPPEGRRVLGDWVSAGGVLALSPRTVADLRDPFLASLVGRVTDDGGGRYQGPRLRCEGLSWGCTVGVGLGSVALLRHDYALSEWAAEQGANQDLSAFAASLVGRLGGGVEGPGDLGLFQKLTGSSGSGAGDAFRPPTDVRVALAPIALLLTLYIIAVGVMLRSNRTKAEPLRVFVRLPALGAAVFFLVMGATYLTRGQGNTARMLAVYDLAAGEPLAVRRVFAGLTAGRPVTFSVTPPAGSFAMLHAGSDSASGALRWDGVRVSIERARLGLWETGVLYTEGQERLGQGIALSLDAQGRPVVENRTELALTQAVYYDPDGGILWPLGPIPPGGRAVGATSVPKPAGRTAERLFGASAVARAELTRTFLDEMVRDLEATGAPGQLWAMARLPAGVSALARGFEVKVGEALVRVVAPSERGLARSRLGARSYEAEVPAVDAEDAGDGAADGDASQEDGGPEGVDGGAGGDS